MTEDFKNLATELEEIQDRLFEIVDKVKTDVKEYYERKESEIEIDVIYNIAELIDNFTYMIEKYEEKIN